jgi:hypothetical protein
MSSDPSTTNFNDKRELLRKKKINIDEKQNIEYIQGPGSELLKNVNEYNEKDSSAFWKIFFSNILYSIEKKITIFADNLVFQLNSIYNSKYTFYELFLNIFFIILIFVIGIILYWDHIYRTASKESRCANLKMIIEENAKAYNPFVYTVMIINKNLIDQNMDKYVLKIEYNFVRKTTDVLFGEQRYVKEVSITNFDNVKPFSYYDIGNMTHSRLADINADTITGPNYKYIAVDHENYPLKYDLRPADQNMTVTVKTEAAENLARFVRDYGRNRDTELYPIYDILNAVEQHDMKHN